MIILDPSEKKYFPVRLMEQTVCLNELEEKTGADFVLSIWDAPVDSDALLWEHVRRGEGVQLKRGLDLPQSVFNGRLVYQLSKMVEWFKVPVVLHDCFVSVDEAGVYFDQKQTGERFEYSAYITTQRGIALAGGVFVNITPPYSLENWVEDEAKRMAKDKPERLVRKPVVHLTRLSPQEETLASFPGVGSQRAHDLWTMLPKHSARQTLIQALCWMTDGYAQKEVAGFGAGMRKKACRHLGMRDGERLWVEGTEGYQRINSVIEIRENLTKGE